MAEVRCPMCSRPNEADAEVCVHCGARLKPLIVEQPPDQPAQPKRPADDPSPDEAGANVPDWLSRIRQRADEEQPEPDEPAGPGPDWLSRLRSAETEEPGPPADEIPDWLAGEELSEGGGEAEQWLDRLRQSTDEAADEAADETPVEDDEPEEIIRLTGRLDAVALDWTDPEPEPEGEPEPEPEAGSFESAFADELTEAQDRADEPPVEEPVEAGDLDWLAGDLESEATEEQARQDSFALDEPALAAGDGPAEPERPDWFEDFERAGEEEAEALEPAAEAGGSPDWLGESVEDAGLPADADEASAEPEPAAGELDPALIDRAPDDPSGTGELDWGQLDWGTLEDEAPPLEEVLPQDLGAPPEERDLPHVPALIMGAGDEGLGTPESGDFDLDAIELPDWLTEAGGEPSAVGEPGQERDLAPATIPSWLEAMRPVETFRPVVDLEPEEEQSVESVGPLAGLRGVLLAEPVVAKPRSSTTVGARLQITERQYAQTELLRRIVEEEEQELAAMRVGGRRLPWVRWLISLVMLVAVLLPPLTGLPVFATPERVSRDLGPLIEVVNSAPTERPALVVFDYEPGYSAELGGVAGALLNHMMARGIPVVTVSTRPTGPPLALDLVNQIGQPYAIENGRNYVHLGYLSGGPAAVLLFSAAPREAILKGFMLPADLPGDSGWDLPILRSVGQLSDFGMVAVIATGTDAARTWAEQASPWLGDTPLVMVLSAGAEPLIRPYFESLDPKVDGILAGLPSAVAYEQINGRPGDGLARWDSFGSAALAAELILAAGIVYGLAGWVVRRRRKDG